MTSKCHDGNSCWCDIALNPHLDVLAGEVTYRMRNEA